ARIRDRLAGLLRPGVHVVDAPEALAVVAERHARLAGGPRGEVGAPRTHARAGRRLAELRDARRVIRAGRLLLDADLLGEEVRDRLPGGGGLRRRRERRGRTGALQLGGEARGGGRRLRGGRRGSGGDGVEHALQLSHAGEGDFEAHARSASAPRRAAFSRTL